MLAALVLGRIGGAATDRSTTPVKEPDRDAVRGGNGGNCALRPVQTPRAGDDPGDLRRVGVAEHDLPYTAAPNDVIAERSDVEQRRAERGALSSAVGLSRSGTICSGPASSAPQARPSASNENTSNGDSVPARIIEPTASGPRRPRSSATARSDAIASATISSSASTTRL